MASAPSGHRDASHSRPTGAWLSRYSISGCINNPAVLSIAGGRACTNVAACVYCASWGPCAMDNGGNSPRLAAEEVACACRAVVGHGVSMATNRSPGYTRPEVATGDSGKIECTMRHRCCCMNVKPSSPRVRVAVTQNLSHAPARGCEQQVAMHDGQAATYRGQSSKGSSNSGSGGSRTKPGNMCSAIALTRCPWTSRAVRVTSAGTPGPRGTSSDAEYASRTKRRLAWVRDAR